ncbi:hypothetical protein RB653_009626 [Dictyostelium firmibasis]|uniref:DUF6748 domain-containing protein n=1 Tax=Dictyostelium firmibasis TaxID=79012 RepID=A0AAN7YXI7_9MYCE
MKLLFSLIILFQLISFIKSERGYYTFREDERKCASPECGGLFLKKINSPEDEIYVSSYMMVNANLNPTSIEDDKNIIVSGYVMPSDEGDGYNGFFLKGIHQRMIIPKLGDNVESPSKATNIITRESDSYYFLSNHSTECIDTDSCPIYKSLKINSKESTNFSTYTEPYTTSVPLLDLKWFNSRLIKEHVESIYVGSIVLGTIEANQLSITEIFINIEDPVFPCKKNTNYCSTLHIPTFSRSSDRCPIFEGCVLRKPCHLAIPSCPKGYKSYSYPSHPNGCLKYYCDPECLPNPHRVSGP